MRGSGILLVSGVVLALVSMMVLFFEIGSANEIRPNGYSWGTVTTYVNDGYGNLVGQEAHAFWGATSGTDYFVDPTPESIYVGGAGLTCGSGNYADDECRIEIGWMDSVIPSEDEFYSDGTEDCTYGDSDGVAVIYGKVDGGCSLLRCTIAVEYHAGCYNPYP